LVNEEVPEISFSDKSQSYCVCFVSMVDSTKITFTIKNPDKIRKYYSIFINTMAAIARNFAAKVIKNTGTSLVYYFPKTSDLANTDAFKDVIEYGITMVAANKVINTKLKEEELPSLYYRISADYGRVEIARSLTSPNIDDLFGSTMNVCAKINSMATPNGIVIGSGLYHILRKSLVSFFDDNKYDFKKIGEHSIADLKEEYSVFSVALSKDNNNTKVLLNFNEQIAILKPPTQIKEEEERKDSLISQRNKALKSDTDYNNNHNLKKNQEEGRRRQRYSYSILLVDDDPDISLTYKTFLGIAGYNVDAFTDSQEALMHFVQANNSYYYNLVIMDIRMPGLNGLQLYSRLRAINPNIKVLFVSALDAAEELISILPAVRVGDIIQKPLDKEKFLYKVKAALV
jgi:two-component system, OmpR family, response regulator ChvI